MANVTQSEWLDQNSARNYPIRENAQRRPHTSGGEKLQEFALPNYVIVDFVMTVGAGLSTDVYLMKFALLGDTITLVFGVAGSVVASATVDVSKHTVNKGYDLVCANDYEDSAGCVVLGDISRLRQDIPDGVYNYTAEETTLEKRCIRPAIRRVTSLSIANDVTGYSTKKLRGDVKLIAGRNITLKYDHDRNAIWINAEDGAGYNETCECGKRTTVKTINGISVENITLIGDDCVKVNTDGKTIKISDACSKPCCGCAEIDFINEKIAQINTAINKLDTYTQVLTTRLTELQSSYVQSDTGGK